MFYHRLIFGTCFALLAFTSDTAFASHCTCGQGGDELAERGSMGLAVRQEDPVSLEPINPPGDIMHDSHTYSNVLSGMSLGSLAFMATPITMPAGIVLSGIFGIDQLAHTVNMEKEMEKWKMRMEFVRVTQARQEKQRIAEQLIHERWRVGNETERNWWNVQDPVHRLNYYLHYRCMNETSSLAKRSTPEERSECLTARRSVDAHFPHWTEEQKSEKAWKICGDSGPHRRSAQEPAASPACELLEDLHMQYPNKVPSEFQVGALADRIDWLENKIETVARSNMAIMSLLEHFGFESIQTLEYVVENVEWKNGTKPPKYKKWEGDAELSALFWNKNFTQRLYDIGVPPRRFNASLPFADFLKDHNVEWKDSDYADPPWELLHKNETNPYYYPKDWELHPKNYWKVVYCEDYYNDAHEVCKNLPHTIENLSSPSGIFQKSYRDWYWVCQDSSVKNPELPPDSVYEPKEIWRYDSLLSGNHHKFDHNTVSVVCGRMDPHLGHLVSEPYTEIRPGDLPPLAAWKQATHLEHSTEVDGARPALATAAKL